MNQDNAPHPADALPLPEPRIKRDGDTITWDRYSEAQIRAAHREGYELAMSKRAAPLSRDQIDKIMTKHYPLDSLLRESVDAFEACVRDIEAALASQPAQQQAGAAEVSDEQIVEALESAGVKFQRFMGGIGGTQDIWSTSGAQSVKKIAAGVRAILALKATAGGVA